MHDDLSQDCWSILNLAPDAEISDIHRAFEQLRLSYLPKDRDRTIPLSDDTKDQLQRLDRAFFEALDSKKIQSSSTFILPRATISDEYHHIKIVIGTITSLLKIIDHLNCILECCCCYLRFFVRQMRIRHCSL